MDTAQDMGLGPFLTNIFGERYLHTVNHSAFNQVGSKSFYRQHYGDLFQAKDSLFVIVGTDSGLLLEYLQEVGLPLGSRALFIELPEVLRRLPEIIDLSRFSESLILRSTEDWSEALEGVNFTDYVYLNNLNFLESIGATDGHLPEYKEVHSAIKQQLESRNWQIKAELGSELFIIRQLENLAENRHAASCLKGIFAGKTGVILGGGPSLDKVLPWLLEHKEQVVIIAVSRIARRLLEVGLTPHLVFTTDPLQVSYEVSKEMLKFDQKTVLVSAYHACPQLVGQWRGRGLYLGPRLPWVSPLNPDNYGLSGPTVTNTALATARKMGFSQILLAGFDLCFSKEGFSHAQGSYERGVGPQVAEILPTVENYAGEIVPTAQAYFGAMIDLADQAMMAVQEGCEIINVAEEATKIENVVYCPLNQVQILPCEEKPEIVIHRALPAHDIAEGKEYIAAMLRELTRMRISLKKMQNLAQEALECNDGLFGRKGVKADFKYKVRMDKIEKRLTKGFDDLPYLVKQFGIRWFLKTTRPGRSAEWTDMEVEEVGRLYYEAYISSCRELGQLLESAKLKLEMRGAEFDTISDLEKMADFWERGSQLGRAQLMLDAVPEDYPPEDIDKLKELAGRFWRQVDSCGLFWTKASYFRLTEVNSKALLYFRKGALADLETLQESIASYYHDVENARPMLMLIEGYLSELREQPDLALQSYHELVEDGMGLLTEEALKRIAALSLSSQTPSNALLALECLAQISPIYQPHYASMLRLMGQYQEAAEVYGDYLTKVPGDAMAMLKLGQLYSEMNAPDAARTAFGYVLDIDPENHAARTLLEQLGGDNA